MDPVEKITVLELVITISVICHLPQLCLQVLHDSRAPGAGCIFEALKQDVREILWRGHVVHSDHPATATYVSDAEIFRCHLS